MKLCFCYLFISFLPMVPLAAQEADSGIDVRATVTGEAIYAHQLTDSPRNGSPLDAAFRAVIYPTIKLNDHWTVTAAVQFYSDPYFTEDFSEPGHSVSTNVLQANIGYSRFWQSGSINVRAGELSSAFGEFNLRYDDAVNPMLDMPILYGYYGKVSPLAVAGAQIDLTLGKWDARAQLVNSSLMNPRSVFDRDHYGNWAGGAGYTILQGLRAGVSGARGPYLDRQWPYFFPGEANPNRLPGSGLGADVEFARGHWNLDGEWTWMLMPYHAIPFARREGAYIEAQRALTPRWYAAMRAGYLSTNGSREDVYEVAAGFRPGTHELIKVGYEIDHDPSSGQLNKAMMVQLVTTVHPISVAWR